MPTEKELFECRAREIIIGCKAPMEMFEPEYDNIPERLKRDIEEHGPLPCDGGAGVGEWCLRCRYVRREEFETEWED